MKTIKHLLFLLISLSCLNVISQEKIHKSSYDKVKTYKIAFITDQLNLSEKEAAAFWPIYNNYTETQNKYRKEERVKFKKMVAEAGGIDLLSEKQSKAIVEMDLYYEKKEYEADKEFISKLEKILPYKKILKLQIAEHEFKKQMFNRIRGKRKIKKEAN